MNLSKTKFFPKSKEVWVMALIPTLICLLRGLVEAHAEAAVGHLAAERGPEAEAAAEAREALRILISISNQISVLDQK